ncbi:cytochrome P450 736A117 [Ziziphus jujuba]|uniref:Cytochrome P450 736A117 n=1 Tax=Ziziphus jujuba TaxID=326968 RepID=A0A6P4A9V6_ZIZJJ|nr:cytochrome P450 736A117 [Ziziphus jujuba]
MLETLFVSAIPFLFFTIFLIKWYFFTTQPTHKNPPPSPPAFPILGNLHQLSGSYPHRKLQKLAHQYGPLMLLHFGSRPVLIVSSSDSAREIMKTHDTNFLNRPKSYIDVRLRYHGKDVTTARYGESWRQMKSLCTLQLLSNKRVRSFRTIREEEVALFVESIIKRQSLAVNLSEMFAFLSNDVICRVAFGKKYSRDETGNMVNKVLSQLKKLLGGFYVGDYIPWLAWIHCLSGVDAQVEKLNDEFNKFLDGVVEEHGNNFNIKEKKLYEDGDQDNKDFVDVLLELQRDEMAGFNLDKEHMKGLIFNMFVDGSGTSATVLEWAMAELLRHPRVMKKLQEEVMEISNGKPDITENDLDKMHYLKAVIKETVRLYPPVPLLIPRESAQDINIKGYDIAAGTMVITNAWALGRDPNLWEKPEEFVPERFLDSSIDFKGQDFQLIPFGSGRRGCPGILFAMVANELLLANLVHKFDWSLPDGAKPQDLDMTECAGSTIHRKVPLLAVATPRC